MSKSVPHGIYGSLETDAWSRDFDHNNYLSIYVRSGAVHKPLDAVAYAKFREFMDWLYEHDITEMSLKDCSVTPLI